MPHVNVYIKLFYMLLQDEPEKFGFLGVVADLMQLEHDSFETPVSVLLGKRLFHVVVKTAKNATEILAKMKEKQLPGKTP